MHTNVLAAGGIVGLGQEMFTYVVILGGLAAMALGIIVGLRASWKVGIGAGIAAFFGGIDCHQSDCRVHLAVGSCALDQES